MVQKIMVEKIMFDKIMFDKIMVDNIMVEKMYRKAAKLSMVTIANCLTCFV